MQYALNKKFTKTVKLKTKINKTKTKVTVKKLKSKKTYYVHARTYKYVNGVKHVSKWSKTKKVRTK